MKPYKYLITCESDGSIEPEERSTIPQAEARAKELAAKYPGKLIVVSKALRAFRSSEVEVINYEWQL